MPKWKVPSGEFFRRVRYLLHRRRFDQELADDMEFHREMAAHDGGRPLGNVLRLREEARDAWGWTWIERLSQDLGYASRMLRKSPGFTLSAIVMLAVGIGVNVAAFGFFNLMVLKPLPVRDPNSLLRFERSSPQNYSSDLPYPEMAFFREHSKTLSAVLALNSARIAMEGEEKQLNASFVTANFFSELGAQARLGRMFDPGQGESPDAEPVAILSYGFWQRRFGSDPLIAGKVIRLNGKPVTVTGVAASEFSGLSLESPEIWLPLARLPYFVGGSQLLTGFSLSDSGVRMWGRLQPGLTPKVAEEELRSLAAELRKQHPAGMWEKESLPSESAGYAKGLMVGDRYGSGVRDGNSLYPVAGLVITLVLLILAVACGNLGGLLLARGVAREREIAIRVAVGAGSGRLMRQLFTESLLLALLGSVAGLAVGYVVLRSLMALTATPAWLNPAPDWRVVVFAIGIGFAAAILFGLTPALQLARQRHRATLMRQILIGAQVAGSCVLLIVAGLLVRALDRAISADPGFAYQQVISIDPGLWTHGYSPANSRAYLDALRSRLRSLPGVESVSLASNLPLGHRTTVLGTEINGHQVAIHVNHVDPEFLETMKIPLLRGRKLMQGDTRAIVISESLARKWAGGDPLGKQLSTDEKDTVVGICGNARMTALQDSDAVEGYFLAETSDLPSMAVLVRTSGSPEGLAPLAASVAKSIDSRIFPEIQVLKSAFRMKLQGAEYSAVSVSLLGFVALLLACLGIVGLVAYAVSQRTKEIGIRMALGARPAHVLSTVLRHLLRAVITGLAVGVAGAAALAQILRGELYGISSLDGVTYLAAIGIFLIAVGLAALLPARRALRVDPMAALRHD